MSKLLALLLGLAGVAVYVYRRRWVKRLQRQTRQDAQRILENRILNACRFSGLVPIVQAGQPAWLDLELDQVWHADPNAAVDDEFAERLAQLADAVTIDELYTNGAAQAPMCCVLDYPTSLRVRADAWLADEQTPITLDPGPYLIKGDWPVLSPSLQDLRD